MRFPLKTEKQGETAIIKMPIYEIKRVITFTDEEKELINKMIALVEDIDEDLCNNARCEHCPFESLCVYNLDADKVEEQMNKIIQD